MVSKKWNDLWVVHLNVCVLCAVKFSKASLLQVTSQIKLGFFKEVMRVKMILSTPLCLCSIF